MAGRGRIQCAENDLAKLKSGPQKFYLVLWRVGMPTVPNLAEALYFGQVRSAKDDEWSDRDPCWQIQRHNFQKLQPHGVNRTGSNDVAKALILGLQRGAKRSTQNCVAEVEKAGAMANQHRVTARI